MSKVDKYTERGIAFLEGDGVAKDYEQAFYWLSVAYELGSSKAETILCGMRAKSLGAPFDGDVSETASLDDGPDACGVTTGTQTVAVSNVRADESRPANPNRCIACGEEALVPSEAFAGAKHCSPSRGGCGTNVMIPIVEDGLARGVALQPYREPIPERRENMYSSLGSLIHMVKYDTRVDDALKAEMVREIVRRIGECGVIEQLVDKRVIRNLVVVPAPSSKRRKLQPVSLLAELVSEGRFGYEEALKKRSRTESKSRPKGTELAPNDVSCNESVRGKTVLLLDDTYGEGATLRACIRALKDKGAQEIYFLSLCKNIYGGVKGSSADDDDIY